MGDGRAADAAVSSVSGDELVDGEAFTIGEVATGEGLAALVPGYPSWVVPGVGW